MFTSNFLRRSIALLLCLVMLCSLPTGIFAVEAEEDAEPVPAASDTGEEKAETRDVRGSDYVFLDFKVGSASRNFNWQVKTDSSSNPYFAANDQGLLAGYFQGDDPRLYMPVETHANGLKRLGSYVLKSGDIIQVRISSITANKYFTVGGTGSYNSAFYVRTGNDAADWGSCGTRTIKSHIAGQTIQWSAPSTQVGNTLYGVRWDPIQPTDAQKGTFTEHTRIYVDYIYVGPANMAPVSVTYQDESGATLSHGSGYVGYGKKAPARNHGKTETQTSAQTTLWGWEVSQYINGAWSVVNPFLTDPTSFTCRYNTRFRLVKNMVSQAELQGTQILGPAGSDDHYNLIMNASSVADATLSEFGTPLDVTLVMDHSGSMSDLTSTKKLTTETAMTTYLNSLDKTKFPGYYRASCWLRNYDQGMYDYYGWKSYVYHMPMRYYRGQWQMQILEKGCNCAGTSHRKFGIYAFNGTLKPCSHVKWVSMEAGFALYNELCQAQGCMLSQMPFEIGPCHLGKNQYAIESFLQKLYNSSADLKPGQHHTVSIVAYGGSVFAEGYPYGNTSGGYITTNTVDISSTATALDHTTYEDILRTLRNTYVYGATRIDAGLQVLSGELSTIEKSAGMSTPTLNKTNYLPATKNGRKRVVVVMTDGIPTVKSSFDDNQFNNTFATDAIDAAKRIKSNSYTTVFAVGSRTDLTPDTYYTASYCTGTDVEKANNFLNLISSRYKNASAYNSPGTKTAGDYFLVGTDAGNKIATQYEALWDSTSHSITPWGGEALYLYQEIAPEFKIDSTRPVRIFAEPYLGNGSYGEMLPIGEHTISSTTRSSSIAGNGYTLHVAPIAESGGFSVSLQWTDAPTAYAREASLNLGIMAKTITRTALNAPKGYRISAEIPLAVNRVYTSGGVTVPVTTKAGGVYAADSTGSAMGSKLLPYDTPIVEITPTEAALISRTISLKGNIGINYYMDLGDEVAADANAYMRFTYEDGRTQDIHLGDPGSDFSSGYYTFSCQVSAKEMADRIKCQFFYGENSATEESLYSVKTYADRMLANSGSTEKLTTLLASMLHYGAASQLHFGYNTTSLANSGLEAPDYSGAVIEGFEVNRNQGTSLVAFAGASLLLKSETTLRLFFNVDSSAAASLTISYKGEALALSQRSGKYYVDIPNISAKNLDDDFVVSVFDGTDTAEVSYCPLSYCASILANVNGTYTKQLQDVAMALYEYNKAANNYFG